MKFGNMYKIKIQIKGLPGWFEYEVETKEQAMIHFAAITYWGYRRVNDRGQFEWFGPSMLAHIVIDGEGFDSEYKDKMVRT